MSAAINSLILMIFSFLSSSKNNGPHEKQDYMHTLRYETSIRLEGWRAGSLVGWWVGRLIGWWADALEAGGLEGGLEGWGWRAGEIVVVWWAGRLEGWWVGGLGAGVSW
jgi:hypothetical protein